MHLLDGHGAVTEGFLVPVPKVIFEVMPRIALLAVIPAFPGWRMQFGIEPRCQFFHDNYFSVSLKNSPWGSLLAS